MNLRVLVATLLAAMVDCATATVDHDKLEPFHQPEPVTVSEKAAIKFKPQLYTPDNICVPFPAANAAGETTGGLKGRNGNEGCKYAPKGSQIYGRAGWYKDVWAIIYAWYFPKRFNVFKFPWRRHDWQRVVVWIDNPAVETPKIVVVSLPESESDSEYYKKTEMDPFNFAGFREEVTFYHPIYIYSSNTTLRVEYAVELSPDLIFGEWDGESQDLIMWEQLTDAARVASNNSDNFGKAEVPFSDETTSTMHGCSSFMLL